MKALVGAFNQEKALVGAFFVIVQLHRLIVYSTSLVINDQILTSVVSFCLAFTTRRILSMIIDENRFNRSPKIKYVAYKMFDSIQ